MSNPRLTFSTPHGEITVELDAGHAPRSAAHFLRLAREGMLDGGSFYRGTHPDRNPPVTITVVQGGVGWDRAPHLPSVEHEPTDLTGLKHRDGTLSFARSAEQDATSEFFICIGDQPILDAGAQPGPAAMGFAAFGQVVEGMDVVRAINAQPADAEPPGGDERFRGQFLTQPVAFEVREA